MEKTSESVKNALKYMRNLPKIYVCELELNANIFWGLLGCICESTRTKGDNSSTQKYMSLQYNVVQEYRKRGFPETYVCEQYVQYIRTINATILIYYVAIRNDGCKFSCEEFEKLCQKFCLNKKDLNMIKVNKVISDFERERPGKIKRAKQDGKLQKRFEENWRKKRASLLESQIESSQIIRDNFFLEEEFNELADEGATLKRVINFLDKLEKESHERNADNVLIPYKEYHALHEMLSERPWEKAVLQEKHTKIVRKLDRVFSLQAKKQG